MRNEYVKAITKSTRFLNAKSTKHTQKKSERFNFEIFQNFNEA